MFFQVKCYTPDNEWVIEDTLSSSEARSMAQRLRLGRAIPFATYVVEEMWIETGPLYVDELEYI
jgi:hypothetical protein